MRRPRVHGRRISATGTLILNQQVTGRRWALVRQEGSRAAADLLGECRLHRLDAIVAPPRRHEAVERYGKLRVESHCYISFWHRVTSVLPFIPTADRLTAELCRPRS
jgi:hypothetical protein